MKTTLQTKVDSFFEEHVTYVTDPEEVSGHLYTLLDLYSYGKLSYIIWDTETTSLDPFAGSPLYWYNNQEEYVRTQGGRVFCHVLGYYHREMLHCLYIDCQDKHLMALVNKVLLSKILKIGHNIKFDVQMAYKSGIDVIGPYWDTLTASRLVNSGLFKHSLKILGNIYSGKDANSPDKWEEDVKKFLSSAYGRWTTQYNKEHPGQDEKEVKRIRDEHVNYSSVPLDIMQTYALSDIKYTFLIYQGMLPEIQKKYPLLFELETKITDIIIQTERRGYLIDRDKALITSQALEKKATSVFQKIQTAWASLGGGNRFNPRSHPQFMAVYDHLKIPLKERLNKKKKESSDKMVLERLTTKYPQYTFLTDVVLYKTAQQLRGTFCDVLYRNSLNDGNIHCNFKNSDTTTGRFACAMPNLQNIPNPTNLDRNPALKEFLSDVANMRSLFLTRPGYTNYLFDYSQVEMKVFAVFSQCKELMDSFKNGMDIHEATARLIFDQYDKNPKLYRQLAKAVNFGLIFGIGVESLSIEIGYTEEKTIALMDTYFEKIPTMKRLKNTCRARVGRLGYVEDMFGKRYELDQRHSYKAINRVVQGGAANVLKTAMAQVDAYLCDTGMDKYVQLLLTIHDELNLEISHEIPMCVDQVVLTIKRLMEEVYPITQHDVVTETDIDVCPVNWEKKQPYIIDPLIQEIVNTLDISKYLWYNKDNTPKVEWFLTKEKAA
jgi:DNA polymerase I-like protein with 3'-5' exonuclease and polymerase domains